MTFCSDSTHLDLIEPFITANKLVNPGHGGQSSGQTVTLAVIKDCDEEQHTGTSFLQSNIMQQEGLGRHCLASHRLHPPNFLTDNNEATIIIT